MTTSYIIQAVTAKVQECVRIAAEKGYPIAMPTLDFSLKGSTAGKGGVRNGKPIVIINLQIASMHFDDMINDTVPHEVAHAVQKIHFRFSKAHGSEWKMICRLITGRELARTHNLSFIPARVVRRDYVYSCNCRDFNMTALMHRKMSMGQTRRCLSCKGRLSLKVTA